MGGGQGKYNILVYIAFERVIVVIKNDKETHAAKRSFKTNIVKFHIFERDLPLSRDYSRMDWKALVFFSKLKP